MTIPETPKTLLDELSRQGELDELKWRQFDSIYRPVVAFFIQQRFAALSAESDDIVQNVMARLVAVLREGRYRRDRSRFRTYLAALVHNCCIDQMRTAARRREVPIDSVNLDDISFLRALVSFHGRRIGLVLVSCRFACAAIADTKSRNKKTSLRVPVEVVRFTLIETQVELNACAFSSA